MRNPKKTKPNTFRKLGRAQALQEMTGVGDPLLGGVEQTSQSRWHSSRDFTVDICGAWAIKSPLPPSRLWGDRLFPTGQSLPSSLRPPPATGRTQDPSRARQPCGLRRSAEGWRPRHLLAVLPLGPLERSRFLPIPGPGFQPSRPFSELVWVCPSLWLWFWLEASKSQNKSARGADEARR